SVPALDGAVCATGADGQDPCRRLGGQSEGSWGPEENSGAYVTNVLERCWANDRRLVRYLAFPDGPSSCLAETWREHRTSRKNLVRARQHRSVPAAIRMCRIRQLWGTR